jgi:multiple sugar transport system permease protein
MKNQRNILVLLGPCLLILAIISLYPFFYALYMSFNKSSLTNTEGFVGLGNYINLFKDLRFLNSLKLTIYFVFGATIVELVAGFLIALLFNRETKLAKIARLLFVVPIMLAPIVVGITWRLLFDVDYGMVNYIFGLIGIGKVPWFTSTNVALISLMLIDAWQWTPFMMLVILAGLQSLPIEPLEAARIDGATKFQELKFITIPLLIPVILVALLLRTIDAFKAFDIIFATTLGGPGISTETLAIFTYKTGFRYSHMGYASAMAIIMIIVVIVISNLYIKVSKTYKY